MKQIGIQGNKYNCENNREEIVGHEHIAMLGKKEINLVHGPKLNQLQKKKKKKPGPVNHELEARPNEVKMLTNAHNWQFVKLSEINELTAAIALAHTHTQNIYKYTKDI